MQAIRRWTILSALVLVLVSSCRAQNPDLGFDDEVEDATARPGRLSPPPPPPVPTRPPLRTRNMADLPLPPVSSALPRPRPPPPAAPRRTVLRVQSVLPRDQQQQVLDQTPEQAPFQEPVQIPIQQEEQLPLAPPATTTTAAPPPAARKAPVVHSYKHSYSKPHEPAPSPQPKHSYKGNQQQQQHSYSKATPVSHKYPTATRHAPSSACASIGGSLQRGSSTGATDHYGSPLPPKSLCIVVLKSPAHADAYLNRVQGMLATTPLDFHEIIIKYAGHTRAHPPQHQAQRQHHQYPQPSRPTPPPLPVQQPVQQVQTPITQISQSQDDAAAPVQTPISQLPAQAPLPDFDSQSPIGSGSSGSSSGRPSQRPEPLDGSLVQQLVSRLDRLMDSTVRGIGDLGSKITSLEQDVIALRGRLAQTNVPAISTSGPTDGFDDP